jgi:hypothetical protein
MRSVFAQKMKKNLSGRISTDYAGFVGLVDVNTYRSFISENWEYSDLESRLLEEMRRATIIPWTTPTGQIWIRVQTEAPQPLPVHMPPHFQRFKVTGPVVFSGHSGGLTFCAQFEDLNLPYCDDQDPKFSDIPLDIPTGDYFARLDQLFPYDGIDQYAPPGCGRKEYQVTLTPFNDQTSTIHDIPFATRSEHGEGGKASPATS